MNVLIALCTTCLLALSLPLSAQTTSQPSTESRLPAGFVDSLVVGTDTIRYLPPLDRSHIPALLALATNTQTINNFPVNPRSSFRQNQCPLGIFALWCIEAIRTNGGAIPANSADAFPSLNPVLRPDDPKAPLAFSQEAYIEDAAKAYRTWWETAKKDSETFDTHPLAGTGLRWW